MKQRYPARRRPRGKRTRRPYRARRRLLSTLIGSLGRNKPGTRPAKKPIGGIMEALLIFLLGAAGGLALAIGYVPEAL